MRIQFTEDSGVELFSVHIAVPIVGTLDEFQLFGEENIYPVFKHQTPYIHPLRGRLPILVVERQGVQYVFELGRHRYTPSQIDQMSADAVESERRIDALQSLQCVKTSSWTLTRTVASTVRVIARQDRTTPVSTLDIAQCFVNSLDEYEGDPSTDVFGRVAFKYCLSRIDDIARKAFEMGVGIIAGMLDIVELERDSARRFCLEKESLLASLHSTSNAAAPKDPDAPRRVRVKLQASKSDLTDLLDALDIEHERFRALFSARQYYDEHFNSNPPCAKGI